MSFKKVSNQIEFIVQEHEISEFWKENQSFRKLMTLRQGSPRWFFLDGPITANNPMGIHHAWGRTYKDVWQRFKSMQGYDQKWQNGFDCQGLWVEVNVEKELGFQTKKDIEKFGLADFVVKCKQRVLEFASVITQQSVRLGMWMDWNDPDFLLDLRKKLGEDPCQEITIKSQDGQVKGTVEQIIGQLGIPGIGGSYFTFSNENNYMIWLFIKRCWEKGWLYKGTDVMPWCSRCGTGISQHEIVTDGYQELTHASVYLRFPLRGREREALLVWTTTPWTLASNVAAAVHPDLTYVKIKQDTWSYYLAKNTVKTVITGDHEILDEVSGQSLIGLAYEGPYDHLPAVQKKGVPQAHTVIPWDQVSEEEGTGIVHIAPGAGAEDYVLGKEHGLPVLASLTEEGIFIHDFDWLTGRSVQAVAQDIFTDLKKRELLYRIQDYTHRYPVCWRCGEELIFRLVDEWFIKMGEKYEKPENELTEEEKERSLRYQIMDIAKQVKWIPKFGLDRELDWLNNMHDWMISKKRYWGLALPIWVCQECDHFEVIGSEDELKERAVEGWDVFEGHTPHRPYIDAIKIKCSRCGKLMQRIPDVGNPWLDAGIVPFSTLQYQSNRDYFNQWFPAEFITESFPGQFRNWFYAVLAMSTVIERKVPYKAVLGHATVLGEDGCPMHKSWGNAIEFNEGADKIGVDVMRWMFCTHNPEKNLLFGYKLADETRRQFLIPLWNIYTFFTNYAVIDNWTPKKNWVPDPQLPPIDLWIIARLHQTLADVTTRLEEFDAYRSTQTLKAFIDDLSNWYVRRSRRRFWKSEVDSDKSAAYDTLYYVLVNLIKMLAPFIPFVTEAIYQNLVRSIEPGAPDSIHHCLWPEAARDFIDEKLVESMAKIKKLTSLGHSARKSVNIKIRQPLDRAKIYGYRKEEIEDLLHLLIDEINVKEVEFANTREELVQYKVLPESRYWGEKLRNKYPRLQSLLKEIDVNELGQKLTQGEEVTMAFDDEQSITLSPENTIVHTEPLEGYATSTEQDVVIAIHTDIPEDLVLEGLAREIVRRVQNLRKEADLEMDDRIVTVYKAEGDLAKAIDAFSDYISRETLSTSLTEGTPNKENVWTISTKIEGMQLTVGISRNE
ncbi:MAG: isoleucine--tRNA ligase [Spirochaetales bacterium]|nr:isoleucine--tRNA ligase [Spirochaetales bacterium]